MFSSDGNINEFDLMDVVNKEQPVSVQSTQHLLSTGITDTGSNLFAFSKSNEKVRQCVMNV